jgi:hypothetical protein
MLMFDRRRLSVFLAIVIAMALAPAGTMAADTPIGPAWWPSRWGPADEAGASNWMTPEKVLSAVTLVKTASSR